MDSSTGSKAMSATALALAVAAVIVALAYGARRSGPAPDPAATDARVAGLETEAAALKARLAALEGAPKPAADPDKAKFVTMDAVLHDQELTIAELQARVRRLEAAAGSSLTQPAAQAAAPQTADARVLRAQRVEIVDAGGKVRGVIEVGEGGAPAINFLDQDGKVRSEYRLTSGGDARLYFSERDGRRYSLLPIVTESR